MQNPLAPYLAIVQCGLPFTATDGQAFVRLPHPSSGGFYILPVRSRAFRDWFLHEFFVQHDALPASRHFHALLNHLEAEADRSEPGVRYYVYRRVGSKGPGHILLDLANPDCQFVEIAATGWETTAGEGAPLQTSRSTGELPVPQPQAPQPQAPPQSIDAPAVHSRSGDPSRSGEHSRFGEPWEALRPLLNLASRADWLRCLAWLLTALQPRGPYPVLILQGPPGSGKSLAARILRSLIDPSTSSLTPIPSSVRELHTLARHNWILAFDHISTLSPQLTDALCRLSSGLGVTLRETTGPSPEPLQQYFKRPILLTVTDRWSCPAGLARRALILNLPALPPADTRVEDSLIDLFTEAHPRILAALCSALSTALSRMPHIELPAGRCANALAWAVAASPALGCTEEELRNAFAVPPPPSPSGGLHPMVEAVRNLLERRRQWTGSATQLLELLQPVLTCQTPKGVSQQLKSCMLSLADSGIELKFRRLHEGARIIDLRQEPGDASCGKNPYLASPDSGPSPQPAETEELMA